MRDLEGLRAEARTLLNEPDESLFLDSEINNWLNEGAVHFSIESQLLEIPIQITTVANVREYALPFDEGDIGHVNYWDTSTNWELTEKPMKFCLVGSFLTTSTPMWYYKRLNTNLLQVQDPIASGISLQLIDPAKPNSYKHVIGIHPPPEVSGCQITLSCFVEHPIMENDKDKCLLPWRFRSAPVFWACMKCYQKEKSYAEADKYQGYFADLLEQSENRKMNDARAGHGRIHRESEVWDDAAFPERRWIVD